MALELFINGNKMDMFPDEGISLILRTKDARDISKIFDDFSREFSIPASGRNNTALGRAADGVISINPQNIDFRKRQPAYLEINGVLYKQGYIKYLKTIYKQGKMSHHLVNFSGASLILTERLGGKRLQDLNLDAYNITVDANNVYEGLRSGGSLVGGMVTFPLNFTHGFYTQTKLNDGSVEPSVLTPALKVNAVLDAIKADYNLDISFHSSLLAYSNNLQIHAPRVVDEGEIRQGTLRYDTVTGSDADRVNKETGVINLAGYASGLTFTFSITVTPVDQNATWTVLPYFGNNIDNSLRRSGTGTQTVLIQFAKNTAASNSLVFRLSSTVQTQFDVTVDAEYEFSSVITQMFQAITPTYTIFASGPPMVDRLPEIELIELLKGFMQIWNLIPVVDKLDVTKLVLTPYDVWRADNDTPIDITRWVEVSEYGVELPAIPKEVSLKHQDAINYAEKYILEEYGSGTINYLATNDDAAGEPFKVTTPFQVMLQNVFTFTDNSKEHPCTKMFDITLNEDGSYASFTPNIDNVYISLHAVNTIVAPDLEIELAGFPAPVSSYNLAASAYIGCEMPLLFDTSAFGNPSVQGSYELFYENYMQPLLSEASRLYEATAVLPLSVLSQINSATPLKVGDRYFIINVLETDTLTGKTKMEVLNYQRPLVASTPIVDTIPPTIGTLSVVPNALPTQVTGLIYTAITPDSITLQWDAATSSSTYIQKYEVYRDTTLMGTVVGNPAGTSITINSLVPGSVGVWRVAAQDAANAWGPFSDPPLTVEQPLTLEPRFVAPITSSNITYTSYDIHWNEAEVGVAPLLEYKVYVNEVLTHTVPAGSPSYVQAITGLQFFTNYRIVIEVYDTAGYMGSSSQYFFATADDVTPPSDVTGLVVTDVTYNSISLAWDAATDDVGVTNYRIFTGDGAFVQTVGNVLTHTIGALSYNVEYTYKVKAVDARNNESVNFSNTVTQTTVDTVPPSDVVMNPPNSITHDSAVLSWEPATDNVGIAGYNLYDENEVLLEELDNSPGTQLTGLDAVTQYTYNVKAKDVAGNLSVNFTPVTFTTIEYLIPPNVDTLNIGSVTHDSITLNWAIPTTPGGQVPPTAYYVYVADAVNNNESIKTVFGGDTFATVIDGLEPSTEYSFKLKSRADNGNYSLEFSSIATATTDLALFTPTNLIATQLVASTDVFLDWEVQENPTRVNFVVESRIGTNAWQEIGQTTDKFFTHSNLNVANIDYRVKAVYTEGDSDYVEQTIAIVGLAPSSITAVAGVGLSVDVSWGAPSDVLDVVAYHVERSETSSSSGFSLIANIAFPTQVYTDSAITQDTEYWYRVYATYEGGNISEYATSSSVIVTIPQLPAPTNLSSSQDFTLTPPNQTLTWDEVVGAIGYRVEKKLSTDTVWEFEANVTTLFHQDSFISPTGSYDYRVQAVDSDPALSSEFSEITVDVLKVVEIGKSFSPSSCAGDTNDAAYWRGLTENSVPTDGEIIYSDSATSTIFAGGGVTWKICNVSRSLFFTANISNSGIISNITPC